MCAPWVVTVVGWWSAKSSERRRRILAQHHVASGSFLGVEALAPRRHRGVEKFRPGVSDPAP
jgi:hypothetical protein